MKKIVLTAVAAILALAMAGCSFSVTRTETVTDANGNTTTRTSTTTNDNGKVTTSETVEVVEAATAEEVQAAEAQDENIVATIAFENNSGVLIYGLYFSSALNDNWGDNILEGRDPLSDGYTATCRDALTYSADNMMWDLRIADSDGNTADFRGLDMSRAADPQNITIEMNYDAEQNSYFAVVK